MALFCIPNSLRIYALDFPVIQIKKWDFVFVDGMSGTGKTTFLKFVAGYRPPYTGTFVENKNLLDEISFYFHDFHLLEPYGILENCRFQSEFLDEQPKCIQKTLTKVSNPWLVNFDSFPFWIKKSPSWARENINVSVWYELWYEINL